MVDWDIPRATPHRWSTASNRDTDFVIVKDAGFDLVSD